MKSFKRDTNKIGALKSNVGLGMNPARTVDGKGFKVYTEKGAAKVDVDTRASVLVKKSAALNNKSVVKAGFLSMEKGKAVLGTTGTGNVGRRALADVSNVKGNSSRVVGGKNASKPMKVVKIERKKSLQRVSVGSGTRTVNVSSRRSLLGKDRESSQGVSAFQTTKRGNKDLKAPSENQNTKATGLSNGSMVSDSRRITRESTHANKVSDLFSLPVLKANRTSISKENAGSPVKAKVGKKVPSRVSNDIRNYVTRNRVSDGFLLRGQRSSNVRVIPIKSSKSTVKVPQSRGVQPKYRGGPDKVASVTAATSKKSVEFDIAEDVKQETTQEEVPSAANCNKTASDIISKKTKNRRRSYTSMLMTGPKLLVEGHDATKEELPSIDNPCNQLEVSDYVDEIYQYYWTNEAQNPPQTNFMLIRTEITPQMRGILVNWLIEVHFKFDLMQETLYLMVTLLDQYLSQVPIQKNEMQLVGLTALLLASKYEDFWHPRVKELISISAESYPRPSSWNGKKHSQKLNFRLNTPTPYVFMLRFLKAAQSDKKLEQMAYYLIELCLVEYESMLVKPSLLCAAAIYVARCTLHITPAWTPLLGKHARYELSQIRDCAETILRFQKTARIGKLKVTYEKYMRSNLGRVASVEPLERLPV